MSVADILQAMAENASRSRLQRGALIGNAVAGISQVPAQIIEDQTKDALLKRTQSIQDAQLSFQRNADTRAQSDQTAQEAATKAALQRKSIVNAGLQAGMGQSGDPSAPFDARAAFDTVTKLGDPSAITDVIAAHKEMQPKFTRGAKGSVSIDETGMPLPGSEIPDTPAPPSPALFASIANDPSKTPAQRASAQASLDALQKNPSEAETIRHNQAMEAIGRLTAGREAAAQKETARHNQVTEAAANPLAALTAPSAATQLAPIQGFSPASPAAAGAPPNPTGDAALANITPAIASQVKALAEGRMAFPAGFALKAPYWQSMLALVAQYDPSFDAVNYNARSKTRADFTSGKSAGTINALNTVAQHLDRLSTSAEALNNSWSPAYNSVANFLSKQSGNKIVTNFETDKKAVVDELTRAWRQAGGSVSDIKSWSQVLDAANSPMQLHGAIGEMGQLLEGKLSAMENQFKQGMGSAADIPIVTPSARAVLSKIEQKAAGTATASSGPKPGDTRTYNGETRTWNGSEWVKQ